jgi:hypothetical protein
MRNFVVQERTVPAFLHLVFLDAFQSTAPSVAEE